MPSRGARSAEVIAFDTHVVVRLLVADDAAQHARAVEAVHATEREGKLPGHLIGAIGFEAGARATLTFDRSLRREPGFELL